MFEPVEYFEELTDTLITCIDNNYKFVKVSGLSDLEGVLANRKKYKNFIAVDDSESGAIIQGGGAGFFDRRPYSVFICSAVKAGDMDARETLLEQHRSIYRSFLTRIIKDRQDATMELLQFDPSRIPYYEMAGMFGNGCVGLYFIINVDNPVNLVYNDGDWSLS
jgi:hypothetical protein